MLDFNVQDWGSAFCGFGPSFGNGPWFIGWIFPILFWLLIAYLIVSIIKSLFSWKREKTDDAALDILKAKFAAGEINDQEYSTEKQFSTQSKKLSALMVMGLSIPVKANKLLSLV